MLATSSQLLWYTTRATGVVALVLLTASVVLGVLTSVRVGTARWPRFALQDLHKRISLLSLAFVGMHIVTAVSDTFAPIGWISVFVPFTSSYRRVWLGLGPAAFDLLLAVAVSSILRNRISARTWRAVHWLTYASWPLALVHGLGTGTDPHLEWMVLLTIGCVTVVVCAIGWRLAAGWPAHAPQRLAAGGLTLTAVAALGAWTATGPLRPGWALRAGTPTNLLAGSHRSYPAPTTTVPGRARSTARSTPTSSPSLPPPPYDSQLTGSVTQATRPGGLEQLNINAQTRGALDAVLQVQIVGSAYGSGGVVMQQSQAKFGPPAAPSQYLGQVGGLDGSRMVLLLHDHLGNTLDLRLDVFISGGELSGRLVSVSGSGSGFGDAN
jgi:DMSO/TMAO reductase YedYZ heme-binding membrane subunit